MLQAFAATSAGAFTGTQLLGNRFDPEADYRTIETAHFLVHFPAELEPFARHSAVRAEAAYAKVSRTLGSFPSRKTHLVLGEQSDVPAAFTTVFPSTQIYFDAALPEETLGTNDYADYRDWIITHEFTHVAHLQMQSGMYRALSPVLGSWLHPHLGLPAWLKEGLAVHLETELTPRGRGSGSNYAMIARMAAVEGKLRDPAYANLDSASNYEDRRWPWTIRPYLFGYYLVRTLVRHSREPVQKLFWKTAGGTPFSASGILDGTPFRSLDDLWATTIREMEEDAARTMRTLDPAKLTPLEYLSDFGQVQVGLTLSPDGKTLYGTRDLEDEGNWIVAWSLDGDRFSGPDKISPRGNGAQTSVSKSGRFLLFDQVSRARRYYRISDLYIRDLRKKETISVSPYFRARDPDAAPDGKHVAFVVNDRGKNLLMQSDTGWGNVRVLFEPEGYARISGPRYSPDGSRLLFAIHDPDSPGQDIAILELATGRMTRIVRNGSIQSAPSWVPGSPQVLYASDRSGISNIYLHDLPSGHEYRLTTVVGGLGYPVADPARKWVYVTSYRAKGYDVARFRWDPKTWTREPGAAVLPSPSASPSPVDAQVSEAESQPYSGFRHLAPQYLRPSLALQRYTTQFGAELAAIDPLYFDHYRLDLRYDTGSGQPVGELYYFNGRNPVAWSLELSHQEAVSPRGSSGMLSGSATLDVPLSADWEHEYLRPGLVTQIPNAGSLGSGYAGAVGAKLGFRHDTQFKDLGRAFYESGSRFDVEVRQLIVVTGGDPVTYATAGWDTHVPMPARGHTLHLGVHGATVIAGEAANYAYFGIAGRASFPFSDKSGYFLYGYPPDRAFRGLSVGVANAAYILPVTQFQRSAGSLPVYFGRLSLGVRGQLGIVEQRSGGLFLPYSGGIELYQDVVAGQIFGFLAKLGLYHGPSRLGGEFQAVFNLEANDF